LPSELTSPIEYSEDESVVPARAVAEKLQKTTTEHKKRHKNLFIAFAFLFL
jgi:hypothetical protein